MNGTKFNDQTRRNQRRQLRSVALIERQTKDFFFLFEISFIFIVIQLLVLSFVMFPILYYFV